MYINETAMHRISFVLTLVFQQRKYFPVIFLLFRYFGVWFGPFWVSYICVLEPIMSLAIRVLRQQANEQEFILIRIVVNLKP
jgi:hypothetical protein